MTISRRALVGGVAATGLAILGTAVGVLSAGAVVPNGLGHERHRGKGKRKGRGKNLLLNPSFELDAVGTTITNWTVA